MSLYYEAASVLEQASQAGGGSLKSHVYSGRDNNTKLNSSPKQIYALISESTKWSLVLRDVIERSKLLHLEKKLTPTLALLLVHDLLLANRGIAATSAHPLRVSVERSKARLKAEFVRERTKRGFATLEAFRAHVNGAAANAAASSPVEDVKSGSVVPTTTAQDFHLRWARVNTIKTTTETQLKTTFSKYTRVQEITSLLDTPPQLTISSSPESQGQKTPSLLLYLDRNIPDLLAFPPNTDLTRLAAYEKGELILQDKASCFPAYLLDPHRSCIGDIMDTCAAPGNKTSHLAALLLSPPPPPPQSPLLAAATSSSGSVRADDPSSSASSTRHEQKRGKKRRIWAIERDADRATSLTKMVSLAGASGIVTIKPRQDFLRLDPLAPEWSNVGALLLDPSCSGSGMVSRDEVLPRVFLPSRNPQDQKTTTSSLRSKSRRKPTTKAAQTTSIDLHPKSEPAREETLLSYSPTRLESLSAFQLRLLLHAFRFPNARRITYSTCSIHAEENEQVIVKALASSIAASVGWRTLYRHEQVSGLREWPIRGDAAAVVMAATSVDQSDVDQQLRSAGLEQIAEACIRCDRTSGQGTMGFFVAAFVRDGDGIASVEPLTRPACSSPDATDSSPSHVSDVQAQQDADEEEWQGFDDDDDD
ncbi:MAG: hypothetical protein M1825_004868 [Sarcosagium campestre]|nr:MAG: hypothetical protein M1825_004868 [Sarcosagium campestre]